MSQLCLAATLRNCQKLSDYKSGPHHYKPKKTSKRAAESSTQDSTKQKAPRTADADPKEAVLPEDTLSSSSSDSILPPGLF